MTAQHEIVAKTAMLIRKPVEEVFAAFVDPGVTSQFWFSRGSGRLEAGREVTWHWDMYGFAVPIQVQVLEPNARIVIEWPGEEGSSTVEWRFTPRAQGTTFVSIENRDFRGDSAQAVRQALDATEGFTLVLAGLKAWLEHGVRLSLVADRFPDGLGGQ